MSSLQRFRGHFYNWYDTGDLRPLDPRYVSSVDSGNLAGHLIALANACREWIGRPLAPSRTIRRHRRCAEPGARRHSDLPDDRRTQFITRHELDGALDALSAALSRDQSTAAEELPARLTDLAHHGRRPWSISRKRWPANAATRPACEMLFWAQAAQRSIDSHQRDVTQTAEIAEALNQRLAALEVDGAVHGRGDGVRLPPRSRTASSSRSVISSRRAISTRAVTTCSPPRRVSRALWRSPRATSRPGTGSGSDERSPRSSTGAALISWSGSMFEYLMPSLVMRAPAGSLLEQTSRLIVRRQITYGASAWLTVGHFGIRLQCPRSGIHLPVLEFRRAGPGAETGPQRERRRGTLCNSARDNGRTGGFGPQLRPAGSGRRERSLRLLRGVGLHAFTSARGQEITRSSAPSWHTIKA